MPLYSLGVSQAVHLLLQMNTVFLGPLSLPVLFEVCSIPRGVIERSGSRVYVSHQASRCGDG